MGVVCVLFKGVNAVILTVDGIVIPVLGVGTENLSSLTHKVI